VGFSQKVLPMGFGVIIWVSEAWIVNQLIHIQLDQKLKNLKSASLIKVKTLFARIIGLDRH